MPNSSYIFITGATSGIGKAAAMQLASEGKVVIAASRNPRKGAALLSDFRELYPKAKGRIELVECNLGSFESIAMACEEIVESYHHVDAVINNAGVMLKDFQESHNGIEKTWQVNVLAPMLISHLLMPAFKHVLEPKLIFSSSGFHIGKVDLKDPEFQKKRYVSWQAYRQSKLALILLTRLLAPKLTEKDIGIYVQHPGLVNTGINRSSGFLLKLMFDTFAMPPEKGAQTLLHLASTPNDELISGEYYVNSRVKKSATGAYDLVHAEALHALVREYLKDYIGEGSLVFD